MTIAVGNQFSGRARNLSSDGRAVVEHPDSKFVFFVEGAWPGDEGLFEVVRLEKRYGFAKIIEIQKPSADRVTPVCPHHGFGTATCGGCSWMMGTYPSQLEHKVGRLKHALERAHVLTDANASTLKEIIASPKKVAYRNRAQFKTDSKQMGFLSLGSSDLVDIAQCPVLNDKLSTLYSKMRTRLGDQRLLPQGRHSYTLVDLDDDLKLEDIPNLVLNQRRPFKQGNDEQNETIKKWLAHQIAELDKGESAMPLRVLELYAGSGNFTRVLAESPKVTRVLAVEIVDDSLQKMKAFFADKVGIRKHSLASKVDFEKFSRSLAKENFSVLVLDPPREGAEGVEILAKHLHRELRSIIYISCDVATFTRDAAQLLKLGFEVTEIQPIDLFPQTPHVEILATFSTPKN